VAEAHDAAPRGELGLEPRLGALWAPIASSMSSTGPGAPPWSGPLSAPIAATTADTRSARVDATTRAVKVDAFMPCSATVTR